jgi:hypothetical protein
LSGISWASVRTISDEHVGFGERIIEHEAPVRAYRQISAAVAAQCLDEVAARFAYRSQALQRRVLLRQLRLGSLAFDLVSGCGYRPLRLLVVYVLVLQAYATAYFYLAAQGALGAIRLSAYEATLLSLRVVTGHSLPGSPSVTDPLNVVAASEVIISVAIVLILANALGRRYFSR